MAYSCLVLYIFTISSIISLLTAPSPLLRSFAELYVHIRCCTKLKQKLYILPKIELRKKFAEFPLPPSSPLFFFSLSLSFSEKAHSIYNHEWGKVKEKDQPFMLCDCAKRKLKTKDLLNSKGIESQQYTYTGICLNCNDRILGFLFKHLNPARGQIFKGVVGGECSCRGIRLLSKSFPGVRSKQRFRLGSIGAKKDRTPHPFLI